MVILNVTPMQEVVLKSDKPITIVATGAGSGQTYALYFKAIAAETNVTFLHKTYKLSEIAFRDFIDLFEKEISFTKTSYDNKVVILKDGKHIRFGTEYSIHVHVGDLLLVDNAHRYSYEEVNNILTCHKEGIVFTSKPYEFGWRNPKYENGKIVVNTKNEPVFESKSWDYNLVDWELCDQDAYLQNNYKETISTKALPSLYGKHVYVVSGYDVMDNKPLLKENPDYIRCLLHLPLKDRKRLEGVWSF